MDNFTDHIADYAEEPLTRQIILDLLKDYKRPNDKVNELVKKGLLLNVIRGVYVPGPNVKVTGPENFLIANHLRGPSYITAEAALAYWELIPERVYEISSATIKDSRIYRTPMGRFSYTNIPLPYYAFGIQRVQLTPKQAVLIASAEKAVCDKIVTTSGVNLRSQAQVKDFLMEDLRIGKEQLQKLNTEAILSWISDAPKKTSLEMLVKTLSTL